MESTAQEPKRLHWLALGLLVISVAINYADRGNLGVAARSIERDLGFPPERLGQLLSAFFWTYSLCQIFAGKIIDRWDVNWVYALGFLLWSGATGLTGIATGFSLIFLLRLVLGAGESIAYPAYSKIIATSFPEQLRGTANALIDAGSKIGPALGIQLGVEMISWFSWRGMFLAIGGASLLWLIPWILVVRRMPPTQKNSNSTWSPTLSQLVKQRKFWGTVVGLFGGNYAWYFYLTWLPYYFERERHYQKGQLAIMASLPFWAVATASLLFGIAADWFIRRGHHAGRIRQRFVCIGLTCCCVLMLLAVLVPTEFASNALLISSAVAMAGFSSNHWALTQYLSGAQAAGRWTGVQNCLGNFAGVVAPLVTGLALQWTHSFFYAFAIACGVSFLGVLGYWVLIGNPTEVLWDFSYARAKNPRYIKETATSE
jgi:MFS transporter, ACS family, D-galactonate transporter